MKHNDDEANGSLIKKNIPHETSHGPRTLSKETIDKEPYNF